MRAKQLTKFFTAALLASAIQIGGLGVALRHDDSQCLL